MSEFDQVTSIKKRLKTWEYFFQKCHQRKPTKNDIVTAPSDIKDAYKLYSKLKQGDVSGSNEVKSPNLAETKNDNVANVWSSEYSLNATEAHPKTVMEIDKNGEITEVSVADENEQPKQKWSDRFSNKLLLNKTKPRLSNSIRDTKPGIVKKDSHVDDTVIVPDDANKHGHKEVMQNAGVARTPSTPIIVKKRASISQSWKNRVLASDSDFEAASNTAESLLSKQVYSRLTSDHKSPTDLKKVTGPTFSGNSTCNSSPDLQTASLVTWNGKPIVNLSDKQFSESSREELDQSSTMSINPAKHEKPTLHASIDSSTSKSASKVGGKYHVNVREGNSTDTTASLSRKTSVNTGISVFRNPVTIPVNNQENEAAITDNSLCYDFNERDEEPVTALKKRVSRVKSQKGEDAKEGKPAASRKSRKRKADEQQPTDELEKSTKESVSKRAKITTTTTTVSVSRPSRSMNENFVKLNLKKKTFSRGKAGLKGAAYKRHQWKQKMSAKRGTACFKCGEEGHWASKCTQSGYGKQNKDKEAEVVFNEDEDGFLTNKPADEYLDDLMLGAYTGEKELYSEPTESDVSCEPVYNEDSAKDCQKEMMATLKKIFKHETFRPGQGETVERILQGKSTLVMLSTGAGKSLCYQLPAYIYAEKRGAIAVVISPLVSLMEDQVTDLPKGLKGVCLHTNQTETVRRKIMESVLEGGVHFLLCSPEFMCSSSQANIEFFNKLPPISFACIDEAHCLSEWSHNFRPSYLRVCKILRVRFKVQCFLGLTATATKETIINISQHLNLKDCEQDIVKGTLLPPNLNLSVSKDANRETALLELLQTNRFKDCSSIIIYCTRREQTDRLATVIRTVLGKSNDKEDLWNAESYHAGLTAAQRKRIQKQFMTGKLRIVVATVAFGMGLDKSDVRAVIHYTLPKGFESYVQEIGRAGRDGLPAECHVFIDPQGSDLAELEKHVYADSIDYSSIRTLLSMIYTPCKCQMLADSIGSMDSSVCPGHERALPLQSTIEKLNITEQGVATLLFYLELHDSDWLVNMSNVYSNCSIKCYGGLIELHNAARKCIPLGVAMALTKKKNQKVSCKEFTFDLMEVSNLLNKTSGYVKRELKQLQWTQTQEGKYKRTGIVVEFLDLSMRVRTPGNLADEKLDSILDFLKERVKTQEDKEFSRLHYFYQVLERLAYKDYFIVANQADKSRSESLKQSITEYFHSLDPSAEYKLVAKPVTPSDESLIVSQVASFISIYNHEHQFNGRDIAKILYGIATPNFPSNVWGRVRRFWRSLLGQDFNTIVRIATEQLIRVR